MAGRSDWSEEDFLRRVRSRVAYLGKSESALLREAGLSEDLIRKVAGRGRRIDSIVQIARALDWTVAEALGLQLSARVDAQLLSTAIAVAERKVPRRVEGDRHTIVCQAAALFYEILSDRAERGMPAFAEEDALAYADALIRGMGLRPAR
jgi:hypothetical protein